MKVAKIVSLVLVMTLVLVACAQPQQTVDETTTIVQETQPELVLGMPAWGVFIISGGVEHELPGQLTHWAGIEDGEEISVSVGYTPMQQLLDIIPRVPYADDFQVWVDGQPAQGFHMLLDENGRSIPIGERYVLGYNIGEPFPADEGVFILVVSVSRGTGDAMGIYSYYAKIVLDTPTTATATTETTTQTTTTERTAFTVSTIAPIDTTSIVDIEALFFGRPQFVWHYFGNQINREYSLGIDFHFDTGVSVGLRHFWANDSPPEGEYLIDSIFVRAGEGNHRFHFRGLTLASTYEEVVGFFGMQGSRRDEHRGDEAFSYAYFRRFNDGTWRNYSLEWGDSAPVRFFFTAERELVGIHVFTPA
ncbi:MAG: hypothetical protein FWB76_00885 [Oscillospiraceae bacterium]|nr:hypothetical protein [Oscillospiraceae bacterium]